MYRKLKRRNLSVVVKPISGRGNHPDRKAHRQGKTIFIQVKLSDNVQFSSTLSLFPGSYSQIRMEDMHY